MTDDPDLYIPVPGPGKLPSNPALRFPTIARLAKQ